MDEILFLLILLQIKHWYIDFVNQSNEEVQGKGLYGNVTGIMHSFKHGVATTICLLIVAGYPYIIYATILGLIDFAIHYHVDWIRVNYGNRAIESKKFWAHLGVEQMMHQFTYILIAFLMT